MNILDRKANILSSKEQILDKRSFEIYNIRVKQKWRNGRRAGFRYLWWQHLVGSTPIFCTSHCVAFYFLENPSYTNFKTNYKTVKEIYSLSFQATSFKPNKKTGQTDLFLLIKVRNHIHLQLVEYHFHF